jgi:hypothetical protein
MKTLTILLAIAAAFQLGVVGGRSRQPDAVPAATVVPPAITPLLCGEVLGVVPGAALKLAFDNPGQVNGWLRPNNPNAGISLYNPVRRYLTLQNSNVPYHPLFNGLVFRSSCRERCFYLPCGSCPDGKELIWCYSGTDPTCPSSWGCGQMFPRP